MTEPLRIVRGEPTPEELAAVTALVTAAAADQEPADKEAGRRRGSWNDPAHAHRRPSWPGPGGWRSAG